MHGRSSSVADLRSMTPYLPKILTGNSRGLASSKNTVRKELVFETRKVLTPGEFLIRLSINMGYVFCALV